jgi:hypothetical protein
LIAARLERERLPQAFTPAMRDLPGFYWDDEKQRYFALQQEHVARALQQYVPGQSPFSSPLSHPNAPG